MSKEHISWLTKEIPALVEKGVLSADAADRLRSHYSSSAPSADRNWALAIFSIIGALLIGGGIILLVAYNWSDLTRNMRAVVAFAPLLIGQVYAGRMLARGETGPGRREGVATFVMLALGACMALISQTYHVSDDISSFVLTWMLLSVPLVYVFNATLPAMFYLIGVTSWAGYEGYVSHHAELFWPLAAVVGPFMWQAARQQRYSATTAWLFWTAAICSSIALCFTLEHRGGETWYVAYGALFSVFYLAGRIWFGEAPTLWQRPLHALGSAGIAIMSLSLTYRQPWEHAGSSAATVLLIIAGALLVVSALRRQYDNAVLGVMPFLALIGSHMHGAWMMFNLYVVAASIAILVAGYRERRAGKFNGGLLMLSAVIACRFFDSDLGLLARGFVFIGLGLAFIAANRLMSRHRRATS